MIDEHTPESLPEETIAKIKDIVSEVVSRQLGAILIPLRLPPADPLLREEVIAHLRQIIEARTSIPAPVPEVAEHLQLSWEQLRNLVWRMPMREAAKEIQLSDVGLKKMCRRMGVDTPPQDYWSTPPERREKFLERANRSHHGLAHGE
jgi:hypothetical protein